MELGNILFPVDFSAGSEVVAPLVASMARLFDATVFLVHVVDDAPQSLLDTRFIPSPDWTELKERGIQALSEIARVSFGGLSVIPVIRHGDPATEIAGAAASRGIGLIMMSTHGFERFPAPLIGSVATRVLNEASCPVWTANDLEQSSSRPDPEIRSLLCAIDLGPDSRALVRTAQALGERTGAKVRLVYPVVGGASPVDRGDLQAERYVKDCARVAVARLQREIGTEFDVCMEAGRPSRVITAVARHHDADLVIMSRGKRNNCAGLRSEAYEIIRDSPCPVMCF